MRGGLLAVCLAMLVRESAGSKVRVETSDARDLLARERSAGEVGCFCIYGLLSAAAFHAAKFCLCVEN